MRDALGAVQSALVLGGGSDIAAATCIELAKQRLRTVVLAGRDPEALGEVADRLRQAGVTEVDVVAFDADAPDTHQDFIDKVFAEHGDIDVVLLAFGALGDQKQLEGDPSAAARLAATNYVGAVSVSLAAAGHLRRQGHGTLVVMSSVAGERVRADNFVYGSTKAGLDAFTQGLADSLDGSGARAMVVRPGFVRSSMTDGMPDGPMATTPEAVAVDIAAGLRRGSETVWSPARLRPVFAVLRHLPRPIWRKVAAKR